MKTSPTTVLEPTQSPVSLAEQPNSTALVTADSGQSAAGATAPATQLAVAGLQFPTGPLALSPTAAPKKKRNGKVAQLPKPEREMVNLMLRDGTPYWVIEDALAERDFDVSQRNISNWKTRGGFSEWCAAQDQALELRVFQDNLTDFLCRHDAAELPEVGLQSAATNLSAILLRPDLRRELLADPEKYSKLIELQCRLAREIQGLQKYRDEASKVVGGNPERIKRQHQTAVEETRKLICASKDQRRGHLVLPEKFTFKQLEPLTLFTFPEQERARRFQNLFKPGPDNPLTKLKAPQPAPAPAPNTPPPSNPEDNGPGTPQSAQS